MGLRLTGDGRIITTNVKIASQEGDYAYRRIDGLTYAVKASDLEAYWSNRTDSSPNWDEYFRLYGDPLTGLQDGRGAYTPHQTLIAFIMPDSVGTLYRIDLHRRPNPATDHNIPIMIDGIQAELDRRKRNGN